MGSMADRKVIELEAGWTLMSSGISKVKNLLEGVPEKQFNAAEWIELYT